MNDTNMNYMGQGEGGFGDNNSSNTPFMMKTENYKYAEGSQSNYTQGGYTGNAPPLRTLFCRSALYQTIPQSVGYF